MLELALQYDLACPPVAAVVAGASSPDQVRANAKAVNAAPLTPEEHRLLRELTKQNRYEAHR